MTNTYIPDIADCLSCLDEQGRTLAGLGELLHMASTADSMATTATLLLLADITNDLAERVQNSTRHIRQAMAGRAA